MLAYSFQASHKQSWAACRCWGRGQERINWCARTSDCVRIAFLSWSARLRPCAPVRQPAGWPLAAWEQVSHAWGSSAPSSQALHWEANDLVFLPEDHTKRELIRGDSGCQVLRHSTQRVIIKRLAGWSWLTINCKPLPVCHGEARVLIYAAV